MTCRAVDRWVEQAMHINTSPMQSVEDPRPRAGFRMTRPMGSRWIGGSLDEARDGGSDGGSGGRREPTTGSRYQPPQRTNERDSRNRMAGRNISDGWHFDYLLFFKTWLNPKEAECSVIWTRFLDRGLRHTHTSPL